MKELSIEEKAKRYDEAIKVAKSNYETIVQMDKECTFVKEGIVNTFHHMFPELKEESYDERIRKVIYGWIYTQPSQFFDNGFSKEEMLSWLEKQGEHANFLSKIQVGDKVTRNEDGVLVNLSQLNRIAKKDEKQSEKKSTDNLTPQEAMDIAVAKCFEEGEQKPSDKSKPKFHEGEWIIIDGETMQIESVGDKAYNIKDGGIIPFRLEHEMHLWTIQDAKDGDVLADGRAILLFRSIGNRSWKNVISYYAILETNLNNRFSISDDKEYWGRVQYCELKPASKEQRDTLIKAIADAGYTFDFEKKELRKIEQKQVIDYSNNLPKDNWEFIREFITKFGRMPKDEDELNVLVQYVLKRQKPTWSEEDEKMLNEIIICGEHHCYLGAENIAWLKSLKDRVLPKQEWSEEDESRRKKIIHILSLDGRIKNEELSDINNWLKSLRPQSSWKPSDEQMKAFDAVLVYNPPCSNECRNHLITLYNDLQKLREE